MNQTYRFAAFSHPNQPTRHAKNEEPFLAVAGVQQGQIEFVGEMDAAMPRLFSVSDGIHCSPEAARASRLLRTTARVMPLGLAQQGIRVYLVCRLDGDDNERSLALNRILSARASNFTFQCPKEFDLDDDGRFGYGEGRHIGLRFHIEKEAGFHLLEFPLSADQRVVELEDAYEITATVVNAAMLEWWLRGFGDGVSDVSREPVE